MQSSLPCLQMSHLLLKPDPSLPLPSPLTCIGGLLVIAPDSTVAYEYREGVFGDHADLDEVMTAVASFQQKPPRLE